MKIVFMGTPQAAVPSLERCISDGHEVVAVYTQPDRPSGRGQKITVSPVKQSALEHGLSVLQPSKLRIPESLDTFLSHKADAALVVAYGRILPVEYLRAFPLGAINVHFSLLPKYRGAAPVNWAIANGEEISGVTTMLMDEGLDTGDILLQEAVQIGGDENAVDLMLRLSSIGADLLSTTLADLPSIRPQKQDHSAATYAPILKKEDGRIDWSMPAREISNLVRGFQPFPGTYTYFRGTRLNIWKAASAAESNGNGEPGKVLAANSRQILIQCGDASVLEVEEIQSEGKRRMDVRDFMNGFRLPEGSVLGE